MKRFDAMMFAAMVLLAHGAAFAGDSLLRIQCGDDDAGAEIEINGKFRGECPLDIKVKPGALKLRVRKAVDPSRERVFELELRMGEDSVKKVDASLEERLTATGKAEAAAQLRLQQAEERAAQQREAERVAGEEKERQAQRDLLAQLRRAAEAGDADAQVRLGQRLRNGDGVAKDAAKADYWFKQAAAAGNEVARFLAHSVSKSAPPEDVEAVTRMLGLPKPSPRMLNVRGHENVRALVGADSFFALPDGVRDVSFSFESRPTKMTTASECKRNGRFAAVNGRNTIGDIESSFESTALLGGLMLFDARSKLNAVKSSTGEIASVDSVYGAPFPLQESSRFGVNFSYGSTDMFSPAPVPMAMSCTVTDVKIRPSIYTPHFAPQLVCLTEMGNVQRIFRWAFHEKSGCFVGMRIQDS